MQTLAELKAANEAEEAAQQAEVEPETLEVEEEVEAEGEVQPDEAETTDAGPESEDGEREESEDWMKGDEGAPGAEAKFTDSDVAAARRKVKAKLERRYESELEQLRRENEDLKKSGGSQPSVQAELPSHPKWEDFEFEENGSAKYQQALVEWQFQAERAKREAEQRSNDLKRQRDEALQAVEEKVNQHYDRAAELAEKSGIQPEQYQAADRKFRESIEAVYPGAGEMIADSLIAKLGPGSEKVAFNLGVNATRSAELQRLLKSDPSGLEAVVYLTDLKHELQAPQKRKTTAPRPATQVQGDSVSSTTGARAMKKRYSEAKSPQERYNIKKEAKAAKIDTSHW